MNYLLGLKTCGSLKTFSFLKTEFKSAITWVPCEKMKVGKEIKEAISHLNYFESSDFGTFRGKSGQCQGCNGSKSLHFQQKGLCFGTETEQLLVILFIFSRLECLSHFSPHFLLPILILCCQQNDPFVLIVGGISACSPC